MYSQTYGSFRLVQPRTKSVVALTISAFLIGSTMAGCSDVLQPGRSPASPTETAMTQFDAGVIFGNEASYLCVPLERIGLAAEDIRQVTSSCECVRPAVVQYRNASNQLASALRLDFVVEPDLDDNSPGSKLAIEISFKLANGATQPFTVLLLHTTTQSSDSLPEQQL